LEWNRIKKPTFAKKIFKIYPKMKKNLLLLVCVLAIVSCNNSKFPGYKDTDNGLAYKFYVQNGDANAVKPKEGDVMTLSMSYKNSKDSVLFTTAQRGPITVPLTKPTFKGSLEEGFAMMAVGDSASFIVNADSLFIKTFQQKELPPYIAKGSMVTFELKLVKIQSKEDVQKERDAMMAKQQVEMEKLKGEESVNREKYIADNKITAKPTASGLIYIEKVKGKGKMAEKGKTVRVNYTGKLLDGTVFDTSYEEEAKKAGQVNPQRKYEPIEFAVGTGQVIPGWDEGLLLMKEGGKAQFIIPSAIAYGENGQGPIRPYSTLVFDVELVEVK
jgi:FKBP-type peptidyl-prolyl cis-trans isomerase FkpA